MEREKEVAITCPYCWQTISMLIELEISQSYIEDCEVCCQPIQIQFQIVEGEVQGIDVRAAND